MKYDIILHAREFENENDFIRDAIDKNLEWKLNSYLKPHLQDEDNDVIKLEASLERWKEGFHGKVILTLPDGTTVRSSRENFEKLDDLISHLFTHIKTQLAK